MNINIDSMSDEQRIEQIAQHYRSIITLIGEDVNRPGLLKTPERAAKALYFITSGYRSDAEKTMRSALFEHDGSKVVVVRDIEFYSMCEHHILPFYGKVSIAYLPGDSIVGLSKLARVVNICARKLQVQERLTTDICDVVMSALDTEGVLVVCEAQHLCMKMRGVEKQESSTITMEYKGLFETDAELRREILQSLKS